MIIYIIYYIYIYIYILSHTHTHTHWQHLQQMEVLGPRTEPAPQL